ncbi:MAG: DUF1289 domain-containing protein [Proteobacteria bacterium]|nr:MAG: DUF1289 domain-containing protein [Pseudomonadota bacterium]
MTTAGQRRGRRTERPPREFDQSVPSPCISVCTLNDDDVCIGCFRSAEEIREWMILDREQKLEVLERVRMRRAGELSRDDMK